MLLDFTQKPSSIHLKPPPPQTPILWSWADFQRVSTPLSLIRIVTVEQRGRMLLCLSPTWVRSYLSFLIDSLWPGGSERLPPFFFVTLFLRSFFYSLLFLYQLGANRFCQLCSQRPCYGFVTLPSLQQGWRAWTGTQSPGGGWRSGWRAQIGKKRAREGGGWRCGVGTDTRVRTGTWMAARAATCIRGDPASIHHHQLPTGTRASQLAWKPAACKRPKSWFWIYGRSPVEWNLVERRRSGSVFFKQLRGITLKVNLARKITTTSEFSSRVIQKTSHTFSRGKDDFWEKCDATIFNILSHGVEFTMISFPLGCWRDFHKGLYWYLLEDGGWSSLTSEAEWNVLTTIRWTAVTFGADIHVDVGASHIKRA